ncbi:protein FAR1-RELATED SEQUENCE 5-like [Castanea sativa]|uniref:protein FAR1-RELATED SEQUENCE 5-like n=1 Tax=Castanea sativa TaxID=21020 RepID=UPI003F6546C2
MSDSNYHTKTDSQSVRKLNFEDEDSPLVIVEQPEPISIDSNDKIHANVEEEVIPKLGIEFETEKDAYDFYNSYARVVGFSIRRSKGHKGDKDGSRKWLDRVFCCSCEGIRGNNKRDDNVKCHCLETRCGCKAEMKISCRYSEKYCVVKFVSEHTHVLASPRKRIFLRSQRSINPAQAVEAELADSSGIAPKASVGLMARRVGGLDNLGFIPEDYNNYLCTKRTEEMKSRDTGGLLEYLQRMQSEDLNFSYAIQKAMFGKKPQTILTDQDAAMAKALASQWPKTHHRLCVWHMYQNAAKNLKEAFGRYSTFAADFSSCVYDHDYEDDFLDAWDNMLDKYDLKNNSWLQRQFELREKWALVYGRKTFCADMSTTQRSESMNSQIKRYITYNYDLLRFLHHFQRLVDDRRFEELRADFKATQSKPSLEYPVEILKHAASVYTPAVFKLFNRELWLTWDCELHKEGEVGSVVKYKVISPRKSRQHIVQFDSLASTVMCSCNKFEFVGILCAHALKVLSFQNCKRVPNQYILKRWTKDAKVGSAMKNYMHVGPRDQNADVGSRYKVLLKLYSNLAARAALTDETFRIALDAHESTLNKVEANLKILSIEESTVGSTHFKSKAQQANDNVQPTNCEGNKIKGIKLKGRQACVETSRRRKGALEKATRKRKRQTKASSHIQQLTLENSMRSLNTPGFTDMLNLTQEDSMANLNTPGFIDMLNLTQEDSMTNLNTSGFTDMMNLTQAQLPKVGNQRNYEDVE